MFGDKFYKKLQKLMPWQQTVYALALSERMYPNYCLYAESTGRGDTKLFRQALDTMWQYLTERGMHVDLSAILEKIESSMPEPQKEECYGLQNIRKRTSEFGIEIALETAAGKGTRYSIVV